MYPFVTPLKEGVIIKRRNRFIMEVLLDGQIVDCHCPVTGRIGDIVFENVPCLVSVANNTLRKTKHTVEAISVQEDGPKWIGINQSQANAYVRHFLDMAHLPVFDSPNHVEQEVVQNGSRLDFKIDGIYMEVKTPLTKLFVEPAPYVQQVKRNNPIETERLISHLRALTSTLPDTGRAVLLYVFLYDAPPFTGNPNRKNNQLIRDLIREQATNGLEIWQLNCSVSSEGVSILRCFEATDYYH